MKKVSVDLYLEEEVLRKVDFLRLKERRRTLSYLASQIFNIVVKRLSVEDLVLFVILGSRFREIRPQKRDSVMEDMVVEFSKAFDRILSGILRDTTELMQLRKTTENTEDRKSITEWKDEITEEVKKNDSEEIDISAFLV